ncbi:uncharacterized protein LOC143240163 [Tachypleus tridentatus]|uniref:uncharacterized protein LOC143240163 n=1 Tax=Tachypleus tridentatus TaxID=6853 RepID=UPI003FD39B7D
MSRYVVILPSWFVILCVFEHGQVTLATDPLTPCIPPPLAVYEHLSNLLGNVTTNLPHVMYVTTTKNSFFELYDGQVIGLSTLKLSTSPSFYCSGSDYVGFHLYFVTNDLKGKYSWKKTLLKTFSGVVLIKTKKLRIHVQIRQKRSAGSRPEVVNLQVVNLDVEDIRITGVGYLTWIASKILSLVSTIFKETITDIVEHSLRNTFVEALQKSFG